MNVERSMNVVTVTVVLVLTYCTALAGGWLMMHDA
jgi:hypothetical protein